MFILSSKPGDNCFNIFFKFVNFSIGWAVHTPNMKTFTSSVNNFNEYAYNTRVTNTIDLFINMCF